MKFKNNLELKIFFNFFRFLKKARQKKTNERIFQKRGFTLIQSIIVMVILSVSLLSSTYLIQTVTLAIAENRQRITATYLGKECMELTRNLRDSAQRQQLAWNCAYPNNNDYELQSDFSKKPNTTGTTDCEEDLGAFIKVFSNNFLHIDGNNYEQSFTGTETIYKRKLTVSDVDSSLGFGVDEAKKFTCEVSWESQGKPQSINFSQILTDWR